MSPLTPLTPKVFIASTNETVEFANLVCAEMAPEYNVRVWTVATFDSGESALESLLKEMAECDFAVILMTSDEKLLSKVAADTSVDVPTDNLIFEAGLFLSVLGRDRVAICSQTNPKPKLPSDLNGQNLIDFSVHAKLTSHELQMVAKSTVTQIKKQFSNAETSAEYSGTSRIRQKPLEFGDTRHTGVIVDSAFQPGDRKGITAEIQQAIRSKRVIPTKLFYATEEGANAWLNLTGDAGYHFFNASIDFLREKAKDIAKVISVEITDTAPDLISLGSGDGKKDAILLPALIEEMGEKGPDGKVSYFPLDYSFYLITETIKNVSEKIPPEKYRMKPIVGDIVDLASFNYVYENQPNPNLFTLLGNTLGNNDERELLDAISSSMLPRDFLLIEVNTSSLDSEGNKKEIKNSDFAKNPVNLHHGFSPLKMIGYEFAEENFIFDKKKQQSGSPGTTSILTSYKVPNEGPIKLTLNHRYDFQKFCKWVGGQLECEVAGEWQNEDKSVGLVLLHRVSKSAE